MKRRFKKNGFTLVEVLVALMIAGIVLTAAATMADALASGKSACDQMNRSAAYLLQIQTRLSDLIMRANEITICTSDRLVLWHDTDEDGVVKADNSEYTTISIDGTDLTIYNNSNPTDMETYTGCQLLGIYGNYAAPDTTWVLIRYELTENNVTQTYQVSATSRIKN